MPLPQNPHLGRLLRLAACLIAAATLALTSLGFSAEDRSTSKPNYELASRWMTAKIGKLVFDNTASPHWAETSDRFWYAFETAQGRRFYLVDPLKKSRVPLWDNAKMAAMLAKYLLGETSENVDVLEFRERQQVGNKKVK